MPNKSFLKCYFGCLIDGPLHKFPSYKSYKKETQQTERFNKWKAVLNRTTIEKGDNYIHNSVYICYRHFEDAYRLPSGLLTQNAIPTLNIVQQQIAENVTIAEVSEISLIPSTSEAMIAEENITIASVPEIGFHQPSTSAGVTGLSPIQHRQKAVKSKFITGKDDKHMMYRKIIARLQIRLDNLNKKYKLQTNKIRMAKNLSTNKSFLRLVERLPENIKIFTKMQLKWAKKPRGRRFTTEEKIMCLTILKQSPKAFNFLKQMMVLPSKRSLQSLLNSFSMKPGINEKILEDLKNVAMICKEQEKKIVNLIFDEISLEAGLLYNVTRDEIIGFIDNGCYKTNILADHALVFMIKSIKNKTKQPICFTFCKSTTKKGDLKILIKNLIKDLHVCGFRVIATICDQAATNVSTLQSLQNDTKETYTKLGKDYHSKAFEIEDVKVFPLFDPPHLIKGVRNNLLTKDATFMQDGIKKCAKWAHIEMLFKLDEGADELRLINKLTEKHVVKEKIPKMRVKYATQVFSQRVSSCLRFLAKYNILPKECMDTADFLLMFDKLFDSFNGHSYKTESKIYKCCLRNGSPHFQLWYELLPILESIRFISTKNNIIHYEMIPSIKNWIHTIKTFMELWEFLNKNYNIFNLTTRNFNQDPLENFFSSIRSNGIRNTNPNCNQFINIFKTLVVNNFSSPHSARANCEKDDNKSVKSLLNVLQRNDDNPVDDFRCDIDNLIELMTRIRNDESLLHAETKKYVSGYVIKKCKSKIFKKCNACRNDLCRSEVDPESFNWEIDYTKKSLFHPNDSFSNLMSDVYFVISACLRDFPETKSLKKKIISIVNCVCDFNIITCTKHKHELIDFIIDLSSNLILHSWCTGVNRILNGKISKFNRNDPVKNQAYEYNIKKNSRK